MKKSLITKKKIEEAALAIFFKKGFNGASTAEIAEAAGVAEGTIFRYFPTKKTILSGLMIKFIERFGEKFILDGLKKVFEDNKDKPLEVILKAVVMDRYQLIKGNSDIVLVMITEIRYHPEMLETFRVHVIEKIFDFMTVAIKELRGYEDLRGDIHLELAIRSFVGAAMLAIAQRELFYLDKFNKPFEEELDQLVDVYLNGIRKR